MHFCKKTKRSIFLLLLLLWKCLLVLKMAYLYWRGTNYVPLFLFFGWGRRPFYVSDFGTSGPRSSRMESGGRLATMLVVTENVFIFIHFFRPPFFLFLLRRNLFSKRECSDQKTYLAKVEGSAPKPRDTHLSRPHRPFWGPLAAI